jgi:hypothetical protein
MGRTQLWSLLRTGAVLAGVAAGAACTKGPAKPPTSQHPGSTVPYAYDTTWGVLVDLFAARGWSIDQMSKDTGLLITRWLDLEAFREIDVECAGSGTASFDTQMRLSVHLVPTAEKTQVTVTTAFRRGVALVDNCTTHGAARDLIHDQIYERAGQVRASG